MTTTIQKYPERETCKNCDGKSFVEQKIKNLSNLDWEWHTVPCDLCHGKGYITRENRENEMRSWGIHPYGVPNWLGKSMQYGTMKEGAILLGSGLRLEKGQRVKVEIPTNIPHGEEKWFVSPIDGIWPGGLEDHEAAILIDRNEVVME